MSVSSDNNGRLPVDLLVRLRPHLRMHASLSLNLGGGAINGLAQIVDLNNKNVISAEDYQTQSHMGRCPMSISTSTSIKNIFLQQDIILFISSHHVPSATHQRCSMCVLEQSESVVRHLRLLCTMYCTATAKHKADTQPSQPQPQQRSPAFLTSIQPLNYHLTVPRHQPTPPQY